MSAAASTAPRFEASRNIPRGGPRAALAPAQPMGNPAMAPAGGADPALVIDSFEALIALAVQKRDLAVKAALERDVRLVRCQDGRLDVALEPSATQTLLNDLARKFSIWTGRRWVVVVSSESAQPTVRSQVDARMAELKTGVQADSFVQAVLARFPGAEIVQVRAPEQAAEVLPDNPDDLPVDDLSLEPPPADEGSYGADWRDDAPNNG
jgi:DNA polymerase-3 subunit gamma/tau